MIPGWLFFLCMGVGMVIVGIAIRKQERKEDKDEWY
jgi:hypothetical membrane protein